MSFVIGITGHKGLLGRYFLEHDGAVPIDADVTKLAAVQHRIAEIRPDAIVHCAGMTDVDLCEMEPKRAGLVNVQGTENVIRASQGVPVALISTDYIFDGRLGPYREDDKPNPLNVYGTTKLEAEYLMRPQDLICRTTVLYGSHPKKWNFAKYVRSQLKANAPVHAVWDQWGTPTYAENLATMIRALVRARYSGVWHTAGVACINRLTFARTIADVFNLDRSLIRPIKTEELHQRARRPRHAGLVVTIFQDAFPSIPCMTPYEGLMEMKKHEDWLSREL